MYYLLYIGYKNSINPEIWNRQWRDIERGKKSGKTFSFCFNVLIWFFNLTCNIDMDTLEGLHSTNIEIGNHQWRDVQKGKIW